MANKQLPADLESFVSNEVASLCDADPVVLAQYIIALIGNEERNDSLKSSLESKLNEFFDDQTIPFIDRLFAKINGSNVAHESTVDTSASSSNTNKERFNDFSDDEDDGDRNFKHRRQRSNSTEEQQPSRSYNKRRYEDDTGNTSNSKFQRYEDRRSNPNPNMSGGYNTPMYEHGGNRGGRGGIRGGMRGGRGGSGMNRGQNKPQCRDYNEKGFCMRGDMCPFDHGMDRIIVDESTNGSPFPGGPFSNNGMPPMGRGGPGQPPFFGMPGVPDAYDPERSGLMPNADMSGFGGMMPPNGGDMMNMNGMMRGGGMRGRGRGRGRGGNQGNYQRHQHQNMSPLNTTLNVEKIPVEFCQISTINDFFAKFGTITNISVQPHAQKAIIQYSTRAEAESAYNSPDAIFDNRFVKVYWSKEDPNAPTGSDKPVNPAGGPSSNAPHPAHLAPKTNEPDPELVAARAAEIAQVREEKQKKHQEQMKHILEIQKKRETQLQQQIDEQKRLLAQLTNSAGMTQTEKAELLKALKNIQSDIDTSKNAAANEAAQAKAAVASSSSVVATEQTANTEVKEGAETTEDLKKKLARLEAEAANLGIHGSSFRGGRGGYYGRGRGSWPRARGGGMTARTMSLDNRPTKISVKDIPESTNDSELRQHFQQYGNVTSFEQKDSEAFIQYAQRFEAEKAMAVGANYPKGTLQLDWFNQTTEG